MTTVPVTCAPAPKFFPLANPQTALKILSSRLPHSVNVYNMAKVSEKWSQESKWFTFDQDIGQHSWFVVVTTKEGFGQEICVSRPPDSTITPEIRTAFSTFDAIDWDGSLNFACVDPQVSAMVTDICLWDKGNCVEHHPCALYCMDIKDAILIDDNFSHLDPNIQVASLDSEAGTKFIRSTWKYAQGTDEFLGKLLSRNASAGVFVSGNPVAGVGISPHGIIGMLYTMPEYRGQGFAKICMNATIKNFAKSGFIPSCTVEFRNEGVKTLQKKLGFTQVGKIDYVICIKAKF